MENKRGLIAALAVAGLMIVNVGFGDEIVVTENREAATIEADEVSRDLLDESSAAAEKVIETLLADTKLDLDIRLIGPTSVKVAGDR